MKREGFVDVFSLDGGELAYWLARYKAANAKEEREICIENYKGVYVFDENAVNSARLLISTKFGKYLPDRACWP